MPTAVLVSEDSSDLLKEIERLKRENAEMEAAINSVRSLLRCPSAYGDLLGGRGSARLVH